MPTTSTWYGAIGQTAQDRLLAAWPDAPIENEETLGFLLSVARDQVLAFAPAIPDAPETGTIAPGPVLNVRRTNLAVTYGVANGSTFTTPTGATRESTLTPAAGGNSGVNFGNANFLAGDVVACSVEVEAPAANAVTVTVAGTGNFGASTVTVPAGTAVRVGRASTFLSGGQVYLTAAALSTPFIIRRPLIEKATTVGAYFDGSTVDTVDDGIRLEYAWSGAEGKSASVEAYRPDIFIPDPPQVLDRYVYAQLQQAQNLWNAGRVAPTGDLGDGGFSFTPRPLDKTIRQIIRPVDGKPHAL